MIKRSRGDTSSWRRDGDGRHSGAMVWKAMQRSRSRRRRRRMKEEMSMWGRGYEVLAFDVPSDAAPSIATIGRRIFLCISHRNSPASSSPSQASTSRHSFFLSLISSSLLLLRCFLLCSVLLRRSRYTKTGGKNQSSSHWSAGQILGRLKQNKYL